ncbi:MAG TPA: 2Fe-2S iron-sulfur cluster-binding protein [Bryobacteraceae bacterium]
MPESVAVWIDGMPLRVAAGTTVAAAILIAGQAAFRRSVSGEGRGPICGMGICFECRVSIDDREHSRSCQIVCRDGMRIRTR